jgi:Universal stress protein UspA and related nucleotide-binding proteins
MARLLVATNHVDTSAQLADYLGAHVGPDDTIVAVNSLQGGDATDAAAVRDGEDALSVIGARLGTAGSVETHQLIQGNDPAADILGAIDTYDADELVFGIRKRSPTGKIIFGSVAQQLLLDAPVPMRVVPLTRLDD